jgi:hypothetical protein
VMVGGVDGWFRTPSLDEWPSSVGFLLFAIFNWELAKIWLLPKWSQHDPLTSSRPPEWAFTPLWCVENDFPSGLANDGLRNTLHHDYVRRDTSLQKVRRDTLPVELVDFLRTGLIGGRTCQFRGGSPHFCPRYYRGGLRRNR